MCPISSRFEPYRPPWCLCFGDLLRQGQGAQGGRLGQEDQAVHRVHRCQEDQRDPVQSGKHNLLKMFMTRHILLIFNFPMKRLTQLIRFNSQHEIMNLCCPVSWKSQDLLRSFNSTYLTIIALSASCVSTFVLYQKNVSFYLND